MWVESKVLFNQKTFYHCNITVDWRYDCCLQRRHSQILDQVSDYYLFLKMQDNSAISKSTDEIKILNANFKGLESDVEVGKKMYDIP